MINAIGIALSGLNSASMRLNASSANIANAFTSGSVEEGGQAPYTPRDITTKAQGETGGVITNIVPRAPAYSRAYDPDSPFANEEGYIGVPNVDIATEIVNMKLAETLYKANLAPIKVAGQMFDELMDTINSKK